MSLRRAGKTNHTWDMRIYTIYCLVLYLFILLQTILRFDLLFLIYVIVCSNYSLSLPLPLFYPIEIVFMSARGRVCEYTRVKSHVTLQNLKRND